MSKRIIITVLRGGPSAEREVSLRSGAAVARALVAMGHEVYELDPQPGRLHLPAGTEVAFLALHGTYGEDGQVQAELEALGVPYTGCGVEASRISFDKVLTKQRCRAADVPTARSHVFFQADEPFPSGWQFPVVLKPVRQGSSVGLEFVDSIGAFPAALAASCAHGSEVLMEERIVGRETTVGILEGRALPVVEVRPREGTYDYRNKYTAGATEYFCPADFPSSVTAAIQSAALGAFQAVGGRDYARVDVMVRGDGSPVVLEVNTLPGMTETSLLPKAAAADGMDFGQLCERLALLALEHRS